MLHDETRAIYKQVKPGVREDTSRLPELVQISVFFSLANMIRRRRARTGIAHPAEPCNYAQLQPSRLLSVLGLH